MATYIIRAGATGAVKIGQADDPIARVAALQTGHPEVLELLRVVDTAYDTERAFHERFAAQRIRSEWFHFVPEMLTFVPSIPQAMTVVDLVREAKRASKAEAISLTDQVWQSYRGFMTRGQFTAHLGRVLGLSERRVKKIIYGEQIRLEIHELEGLRAIVRKLQAGEKLPEISVLEEILTTGSS